MQGRSCAAAALLKYFEKDNLTLRTLCDDNENFEDLAQDLIELEPRLVEWVIFSACPTGSSLPGSTIACSSAPEAAVLPPLASTVQFEGRTRPMS